MSFDLFFAKWAIVAPAVGNHLWQSTLFAIVAGLLTLLFRRNHARVRYGLWLAASVKFLVPIELLVGLGKLLAVSHGTTGAGDRLYFDIIQFGQPFLSASLPGVPPPVAPTLGSTSPSDWLLLLLLGTWLVGFVAIVLVWGIRWRRLSALLRDAVTMPAGRELETLRRLEKISGVRKPLAAVLSRAPIEPGVFGLTRPVLIWPAGISSHLEDEHLEAILAHELCHVCRRDNLTAALHMFVGAIFWFHPLVWWMGARLIEERERACDEHVLALGSPRRLYAESILKTCKFCVAAPLACVSGVTGDDLKKRILQIMTQRFSEKLSIAKKVFLSALAVASLAGPVAFGLLHSPRSRAQAVTVSAPPIAFDVASIKPDHMDGHQTRVSYDNNSFSVTGATLKRLIEFAYHMNDFQLSGGPAWLGSETFAVQARMDQATAEALDKLPGRQRDEQRRIAVQLLLADRFHLRVSHSSRELPIYALVLTNGGPKFSPSPSPLSGDGQTGFWTNNSDLKANRVAMNGFAQWLSFIVGRKVVDMTGLEGKYDFALKWVPERLEPLSNGSAAGPSPDSPSPEFGPSIFAALQEQLGLKLESQKGPVDTLIIESVEKPSSN